MDCLTEPNLALVKRMEGRLAISPQLADLLIRHWGKANLLLDAAREEGRNLAMTGKADHSGFQREIK